MDDYNDRVVVPLSDAIERIGSDPYVHTFMQASNALIGADHGRCDVIAAMTKFGVEESGEQASAMGHTLVIVKYPLGGGRFTPLFIQAAKRPQSADAVDPVGEKVTG